MNLFELTDRQKTKLTIFMDMCERLSQLSHDPKMKVAALVITDDFREICSIGYNGSHKGGPNVRDSLDVGGSGFLHAEENALFHLCKPYELRGELIMLSLYKPCPMCAKRIVNSGIGRVVYKHNYTALGNGAVEIFASTGIVCVQIDEIVSASVDT